jgi:TadE-like protein
MRRSVMSIAGSAMVETAVSLSLLLLTLFGAFDLGLMGYFQLQLDGATFFFTHAYASGTSTSSDTSKYDTALAGLFPNVVTANMQPIPDPPPTTDMPVNYTQWGTVTERFGGASLLRPQRLMATASYTIVGEAWNALFPSATQPITLTAGNVDARPVIGNHDDDAQGANYNSSTVYNSVVDPLIQDDQNVPPYYFNFGFMWECPSGDWSSSGATCNGSQLDALGLAEYLKDDNYSLASYPNDGIDQGGTFEYVKYHQQFYAGLAQSLTSYTTRPNTAAALTAWNNAIQATMNTTFSQWDVANIQSIGAPSGSMLGRQNPLHPGWGCTWC